MNPTARHNARYYALQAMYQWQINQTPLAEIEFDFLTKHIKRKKTDKDFFKEIIYGVEKNVLEFDNLMTPFLDRPINELDPVELSILRLAIYELAYRTEIPYRVVINEALELTKQFGSIEGFKFVNGILDQVAKKLRSVEYDRI